MTDLGQNRMTHGASAERVVTATIVELLPSMLVRVRLENEHELVAHLPSTQRSNFVRLRVGDRVELAVSPQDATRGRVIRLLNKF